MAKNKVVLGKEVKGLIKAVWYYSDAINIIIKDYKFLEKVKSKLGKYAGSAKFMLAEEFFKDVLEYDTRLFISIRNGEIIYDPARIVDMVKTSILKGLVIGTRESLFRKFLFIQGHVREAEQKKQAILYNLYMAVVECAQALCIMKGHDIMSPRMLPEHLEKYFLGKGLEKTHIECCKDIIDTYKDFEHNNIPLPTGKRIDELTSKAEVFRNSVRMML